MKRIPAHIFYPGLVIALLLFSLGSSAVLVMASRSDGGAQVMNDYYQQSVHWDEKQAVIAGSKDLHWTFDWDFDNPEEGRLSVRDRYDTPVVGVNAQLRVRRPQFADDVSVASLEAVKGQPGVYRFEHQRTGRGVWDIILEGDYRDQPIWFAERQQVQ